jgi:hypothetical protein
MGDHKHKSKKSSKRDHKDSSSRDSKRHKSSSKKEKEIDYSDPSLWVEVGAEEATPAEHLRNHQRAAEAAVEESSEVSLPQEEEARHGWMLDGGLDFGAMGTARVKEEDKPKPNPDFVNIIRFFISF